MTAQHTPGPWTYSPDRHTHDYIIHRENPEIEYGEVSTKDGVVGSSECIWLDEANARLIAAAPELLDALENFAYADEWGRDKHQNCQEEIAAFAREARAAIAKARGQS